MSIDAIDLALISILEVFSRVIIAHQICQAS